MRFRSEHNKSFSNVTFDSLLLNSDHIELDGLGNWSALSNGYDISDSNTREGWGDVCGQVVMSLLKSIVLLDIVKIIPSEGDCAVHLGGEDDTLEDSTSDRNVGGEWTFMINIVAFDGRLWGLETKTDLLVVSWAGGSLLR